MIQALSFEGVFSPHQHCINTVPVPGTEATNRPIKSPPQTLTFVVPTLVTYTMRRDVLRF